MIVLCCGSQCRVHQVCQMGANLQGGALPCHFLTQTCRRAVRFRTSCIFTLCWKTGVDESNPIRWSVVNAPEWLQEICDETMSLVIWHPRAKSSCAEIGTPFCFIPSSFISLPTAFRVGLLLCSVCGRGFLGLYCCNAHFGSYRDLVFEMRP